MPLVNGVAFSGTNIMNRASSLRQHCIWTRTPYKCCILHSNARSYRAMNDTDLNTRVGAQVKLLKASGTVKKQTLDALQDLMSRTIGNSHKILKLCNCTKCILQYVCIGFKVNEVDINEFTGPIAEAMTSFKQKMEMETCTRQQLSEKERMKVHNAK
jgi:hypothetical protein